MDELSSLFVIIYCSLMLTRHALASAKLLTAFQEICENFYVLRLLHWRLILCYQSHSGDDPCEKLLDSDICSLQYYRNYLVFGGIYKSLIGSKSAGLQGLVFKREFVGCLLAQSLGRAHREPSLLVSRFVRLDSTLQSQLQGMIKRSYRCLV